MTQAASLSGRIAVVATAIRFEDPPLARFLFSDPRLAWLWLPLRVWLGWRWLDAERHNSPGPRMDGDRLMRSGSFWEGPPLYLSRDAR